MSFNVAVARIRDRSKIIYRVGLLMQLQVKVIDKGNNTIFEGWRSR